MIKWLKAIKVKDGWSIVIINRIHLYSKSDVIKLIKQLGLEIKEFYGVMYEEFEIFNHLLQIWWLKKELKEVKK